MSIIAARESMDEGRIPSETNAGLQQVDDIVGGAPPSSSRKRKAPTAVGVSPGPSSVAALSSSSAQAAVAATAISNGEQRRIRASGEALEEMRRRVFTVVEETMRNRLAGTKGASNGDGNHADAASAKQTDPTTVVYLKAFQGAVHSKVASVCELPDEREQKEAEELMGEMLQFAEHKQAARKRLRATRERVARLCIAACQNSLRTAGANEDVMVAALETKIEQARKDAETGRLPRGGGAGHGFDAAVGIIGDGLHINDRHAIIGFAGIDSSALEPKVSRLIGTLAELPGPLKTVLQEMPELTASLAKTVQSVNGAIEAGESRTEALLGKAPPMPLAKKMLAGGGGGGVGGSHGGDGARHVTAGDARAAAKEARAEQARREWQAARDGVLGGTFG